MGEEQNPSGGGTGTQQVQLIPFSVTPPKLPDSSLLPRSRSG